MNAKSANEFVKSGRRHFHFVSFSLSIQFVNTISNPNDLEKPLAGLDGTKSSVTTDEEAVTVVDLVNADKALAFLAKHPRTAEIAIEGMVSSKIQYNAGD
jgi:hypothetical protein